jgi:restriction system protein
MSKPLAPSRRLAAKVIHATLSILHAKGGEAPSKDIIEEIERTVHFDEWAKATYEKTGYVRWKSILHFYTIDLIKAGFLVKKKGVWYLTPEGDAVRGLGEVELLETASNAYRSWREANPKKEKNDIKSDVINDDLDRKNVAEQAQEATLQEVEELANDGLRNQINSLNPYEFQDLVGALLRAMGYYTPFIAPKGKDGGVDIIAYQDPLGVKAPRIKVQIKHRESSASVDEVRQLMGLLQRDGDVGIFVSSGGFTSDTKITARSSHIHVELIDLDRLISLWQEFYPRLEDEDKNRLRLKPIYFFEPHS